MDKEELLRFKEKYQNKWVAISQRTGRVLAFDKDLKKLSTKIKIAPKGYLIEKVLPLNIAFAPLLLV
ncbi:MAG: DUF5678 domain-containing protein [Patescibacteria group bacterium]